MSYSQKKECISFVFSCFDLSIAITLEPLVPFRWHFQQNVPLLMKASNRKHKMSHMFDFGLIPLDRITYYSGQQLACCFHLNSTTDHELIVLDSQHSHNHNLPRFVNYK